MSKSNQTLDKESKRAFDLYKTTGKQECIKNCVVAPIAPHKTKKTIIKKEANVDIKIIPVIKWLNNFEGVETSYSCQGNDLNQKPYITFQCRYSIDLAIILNELEAYSTVTVNWDKWSMGNFKYTILFLDDNRLSSFIESLKSGVIKSGGNYHVN